MHVSRLADKILSRNFTVGIINFLEIADGRLAVTLGRNLPMTDSKLMVARLVLVSPSVSNPLAFLLSRGPAISIPVGLLATGAIGTTLLGSFLAWDTSHLTLYV